MEGGTLVFVFEVEDDLIEVLQRQRLEDLPLALRIVGHVPALTHPYVTNFFIDSISSFFYSLEVFIQNYSYISQTAPSLGPASTAAPRARMIRMGGVMPIQKDTQINR